MAASKKTSRRSKAKAALSKSESHVYVGASKRITVALKPPGENSQPISFTFWPGRPNKVRSDIWGAMQAKKSSPDKRGQATRGPVQVYLDEGVLWTMSVAQALAVHEKRIPSVSPMGPNVNMSKVTPADPEIQWTQAQKQVVQELEDRDPEPRSIEVPVDALPGAPPPPPTPVAVRGQG